MKITAIATPNHGARPKGMPIDTIVLHATADKDAKASISWIKSPDSKVSYHVLIDRDGVVYRFVETARRAWACGESEFQGRPNVNDYSLSMAFANRNDGVEPYTDLQYQVGAAVASAWMRVFPAITENRITTHAEISPGRKTDPKGFDLARFKQLVAEELSKPAAGGA